MKTCWNTVKYNNTHNGSARGEREDRKNTWRKNGRKLPKFETWIQETQQTPNRINSRERQVICWEWWLKVVQWGQRFEERGEGLTWTAVMDGEVAKEKQDGPAFDAAGLTVAISFHWNQHALFRDFSKSDALLTQTVCTWVPPGWGSATQEGFRNSTDNEPWHLRYIREGVKAGMSWWTERVQDQRSQQTGEPKQLRNPLK